MPAGGAEGEGGVMQLSGCGMRPFFLARTRTLLLERLLHLQVSLAAVGWTEGGGLAMMEAGGGGRGVAGPAVTSSAVVIATALSALGIGEVEVSAAVADPPLQ